MACGWMVRPLGGMVLAGLVLGVALPVASHAQKADETAALKSEVMRLYQAGKYAEATKIAEQLLAIREKALGPGHPDVGQSLNNLAELYRTRAPRRGHGTQQPRRGVPGAGALPRRRAAL